MIGVANRDYVAMAVHHGAHPLRSWRASGWNFNSNVRIGTINQYFSLSGIPFNRGGKKLYVDGVRFGVAVADPTDYLTTVEARVVSLAGTSTQRYISTTNRTSAQTVTSNITAFELGSYSACMFRITVISATAGQCSITTPELRCFYDT